MKLLLKALMISILSLLVNPQLVMSAAYYVDCYSGDDSNPGFSWELPFKTIKKAIESTVDGDIVYVNQGIYREAIIVYNRPSAITIRAIGEVIIEKQDNGAVVAHNLSKTIIDGFTFRDCRNGAYLAGLRSGVVANCKFYNNDIGIFFYGIGIGNLVKNCVFYKNRRAIHGQGLLLENEIKNNTIVCNHQEGVYLDGTYLSRAAYNNLIENNIIYKNGGSGICSISNSTFTQRCDYNNILANNSNYSGDAKPGPHDVSVDPMFLDETNDLYYLRPNSPCLKAGPVENGEFQNIGALGIGQYSSYTADSWTGWIDENGSPIAASNFVELDADGNIKLKERVKSAAIRSPVIDTQKDTGRIKSITFNAEEFPELESGFKQVIDYDETTYTREVKWRGSNNLFSATDPLPEWQKAYKNTKIEPTDFTRYIQIELTLRLNAR